MMLWRRTVAVMHILRIREAQSVSGQLNESIQSAGIVSSLPTEEKIVRI